MLGRTPLLALLALFFSPVLHGQNVKPAVFNGARLVGGGIFSAFSSDYDSAELYGVGGFIDLNLRQHFGAEGELRFLRFNQTADMYEDNFAFGPRYRWQFRRYEFYGKFLVGDGQFNFPFNYAHGGYFVLVPGGGLDIHWHRFTFRAIDYESQHWINFQHTKLTPDGFSTGIGYRIF